MHKILITGGAGFIGYHLAESLSQGRCRIDLADNLLRGEFDRHLKRLIKKPNVRFIKADLTDLKSYKLLRKDYDYIYHMAAIVCVKKVIEQPDRVLYINIVSILNLLEWARTTQGNLKKLLFASTSEAYAGSMRCCDVPIPTNEDVILSLEDIRMPRTTYALSKIVGESACFSYLKNKAPFTIVRYHNVYGPRMGYSHVIPELMVKARKSNKYLEVFSVNHTRAFCYISDAVLATIGLAESKLSSRQIFNVGNSDEEITIKDLAQKIVKLVNPSLKIKPLGNQEGSPLRRCPDISKLKHATGFRPEVSLDEGIRLTWQWYANGDKKI